MSVFSKKIVDCSPGFSKSMKTIADFYLENLDAMTFSTLEEVAGSIGVSTTTVIRFARELGYTGYTQMQKAIQAEVLSKVSLPERLDSLQNSSNDPEGDNHLLQASMQRDMDNISETLARLDETVLGSAVDRIIRAENVYLLGMRGSFSLACYMMSRLGQLRPNVHLIESSGLFFPESMNGCGETDVCIVFTFPRHSKTTIDILEWLKKRKVCIIMITSESSEVSRRYADLCFNCVIKSISVKNSIAAPIALINYLTAAAAIKAGDTAESTIRDTEEFLIGGIYSRQLTFSFPDQLSEREKS
ncbi:MAG: MurR/RpiR family transcriptional regulator [Eubacteriales bacterium]|nr:MurR/RpiR family transcriptional regulator [Eubacteriales bacterium]